MNWVKRLFGSTQKQAPVSPEKPRIAHAIPPTPTTTVVPTPPAVVSPPLVIVSTPITTEYAARALFQSDVVSSPLAQVSTLSPILEEPVLLTLAPGITMTLVRVPSGVFTMGSWDFCPGGQADEKPLHKVKLDEYLIGKYEVTVAQFHAFVQASRYKVDREWYLSDDDYYPMSIVNWNDALAFCTWASEVTGWKVRLPSEAEWEKAARGSYGRLYPWGNEEPDNSKCNYYRHVGGKTRVGKYSPSGDSPYGCADMAGNVWEWVNDWYERFYYKSSPRSNPKGPAIGTTKVLRGGSWVSYGNYDWFAIRAVTRHFREPDFRGSDIGFRCAASPCA